MQCWTPTTRHIGNRDSSGRILIPEKFRKAADISDEVTMVGAGTRVELWNPKRWEAVAGDANEKSAARFQRSNGDRRAPPGTSMSEAHSLSGRIIS